MILVQTGKSNSLVIFWVFIQKTLRNRLVLVQLV